MRWTVGLLAAAIAALWILAHCTPKPAPGLPDRFVGSWEIFRYEPPAGTRPPNPIRAGERIVWEFDANGAYRHRTIVGEYEIKRDEGVAVSDGDVLTLRRISRDRIRLEGPEDPWRVSWDGDHMLVENIAVGGTFWLRRVEPQLSPAAASSTR